MRAVVFDEFGVRPQVRDVPDPVCTADGVVIAVEATGVCRSDWQAWRGHDPSVTLAPRRGPRARGQNRVGRRPRAGVAARRPGYRAVRMRARHLPAVRRR